MVDDKTRGWGGPRGERPTRTDTDDLFGFDAEGDGDNYGYGRREPSRRMVGEFVRRAIENTMGQVQSTSSVSREALQFLLQQGDKGRREMVRLVASEVGDFLRHTDVASEVVRVMTSVQVDVSASIRFKPVEGGGVRPEVAQDVDVSVAPTQPAEPETDDGTSGVVGGTPDPAGHG